MPKRVDHELRRRELADAVCRVVAREGLDGASLQLVAREAGWSIGSLRYYFATKADLLVFALRHAGVRIEERIGRLPVQGTTRMGLLRAVIAELLPLDTARHEEALVWLAFVARATVDADLASAAEDIWTGFHVPLVAHVAAAVAAGELPAELDAEREASRLHALIDGLVVQMVSAPHHATAAHALAVVDDHLAALARYKQDEQFQGISNRTRPKNA